MNTIDTTKLKVGDELTAIAPIEINNSKALVVGKKYKITSIDGKWITIDSEYGEGHMFALQVLDEYFTLAEALPSNRLADEPQSEVKKHVYDFKIYNGRVKVYIDGIVAFTFNQLDFSGYYAFKDDTSLYGITIYMNREKASPQEMDIYFKTKENWKNTLLLLDKNL
jgi:hypothetical protein